MTVHLALLIAMGVMAAAGVSMLLERNLTRVLIGFLLVGNALNILIFSMSGSFGDAPLIAHDGDASHAPNYSDPLPQAFILTAVVITFGTVAFLLAHLYRAWKLGRIVGTAEDEEDVALMESPESAFEAEQELLSTNQLETEFPAEERGDAITDAIALQDAARWRASTGEAAEAHDLGHPTVEPNGPINEGGDRS